MPGTTERLTFPGHVGAELAARLDRPDGTARGFALFAHCFTCSKDVLAARRIAAGLADHGFAVLRFDFTGLGSSQGEFASTNFSSNVADLLAAADCLRRDHEAPAILIGHSLGGAAILSVAADVPEAKAVAVIGAPADAHHVIHNFGAHLDQIEATGEAEVTLGGRAFTIRKQFIDDLAAQTVVECVGNLRRPLMIFHSPVDQTVGIDNAARLYAAARHPKSFISLDTADHLLTNPADAQFVADVIAAWASRYV